MLCSNPYVKTQTGVSRLKYVMSEDAKTATTPFPCGRCLHCKINKSREWTNRLLLENMASADSKFITLTYDEEHLPDDKSLEPKHLRNFLQTLRRRHHGIKIRYYAVGEYGDTSWRPHYHLAVFGSDSLCERQITRSWRKGFSHSGDLTKDSARYLTGYIIKKITKGYYQGLGERLPEFSRSSRKGGGIGVPAINQIAKKLTGSQFFDSRIIREVRIGKQVLPLGRYLTEKLSNKIGITENQKRIDLLHFQYEQIENYIDDVNPLYSMLKDTEAKRESKQKRHKIWNQRKTI